jgi:hypothetical protein
MINWVCVRIAVIKKRFRMLIPRANMSSIIAVLLLLVFGRNVGRNGRSCGDGGVPINARIAFVAVSFCEEGTSTVVVVLALVALVAFPFKEVFAEKRHVCDNFLAWRVWLAAASCAFAAS